MSKSRRSQPTPVQTRQDTIDVDCCVGKIEESDKEQTKDILRLSFPFNYWLLLVINKPIVLQQSIIAKSTTYHL